MNKKYTDIILSLFFIILAVLLYRSTASFPQSSILTTVVYINFLAISLGICGSLLLVKSFFIDANARIVLSKNPKNFFILGISLIIYVWVMEFLGFIIASMFFLPATMSFMGYDRFRKSIIISAGVTLFVYVLFVTIFEIQLPEATVLFED